MRRIFTRWGLPRRIRVDNGFPWGPGSELPPAMALWWMGLGIEVLWTPPRHPQANGQVERFHGLLDHWGEPARCANPSAWQRQVDWVVQTQREAYPAVEGTSRWEAYPTLRQGGRPYHPAHETQEWDLARVEAYLAQGVWPRRVDQVGRITLYNRPYGVGRAYAGQQVWVRFEAATHMWVIRGAEGQEWARHPAQEIALETICRLEVSQVKPSRRKRARQNLVADVAA